MVNFDELEKQLAKNKILNKKILELIALYEDDKAWCINYGRYDSNIFENPNIYSIFPNIAALNHDTISVEIVGKDLIQFKIKFNDNGNRNSLTISVDISTPDLKWSWIWTNDFLKEVENNKTTEEFKRLIEFGYNLSKWMDLLIN